jgi:hypothetical protein
MRDAPMGDADQRDIATGEVVDLELIRRFIVIAEEAQRIEASDGSTCGELLNLSLAAGRSQFRRPRAGDDDL